MPLKIRPLPPIRAASANVSKPRIELVLSPTPWTYDPEKVSGAGPVLYRLDEDAVHRLFLWLSTHYAGQALPDFVWASVLDMHRLSWIEWRDGLRTLGFLEPVRPHISEFGEIELTKLRSPWQKDERAIKEREISLYVTPYDPWQDRSWDRHFTDRRYPFHLDEIVDGFYQADVDEHLIYYGVSREIEPGILFRPIRFERPPGHDPEHLSVCVVRQDGKTRYLEPPHAEQYRQADIRRPAPPPQDWATRVAIAARTRASEAASSGTGPKILGSWIPSQHLRAVIQFHARHGHPLAPVVADPAASAAQAPVRLRPVRLKSRVQRDGA